MICHDRKRDWKEEELDKRLIKWWIIIWMTKDSRRVKGVEISQIANMPPFGRGRRCEKKGRGGGRREGKSGRRKEKKGGGVLYLLNTCRGHERNRAIMRMESEENCLSLKWRLVCNSDIVLRGRDMLWERGRSHNEERIEEERDGTKGIEEGTCAQTYQLTREKRTK